MIVQSNAFCSRPLKLAFSLPLSATRPDKLYAIPTSARRGYAIRFQSPGSRDTILEDRRQDTASTCWSLLSPSWSEIVGNISSLKIRKAKLPSGKTPLVVLLVTPAHIRLLDDGINFVPSLYQHALENAKSWQVFDLVAAVVDRIPQTSSTASYTNRNRHAPDEHHSPTVRKEDGCQGISVAVLDSEAATPDLWLPRATSSERERMTIQQRCTLSFSFHPSHGVRTQIAENLASQPLVKRTLQLPVANTLFQNGKTSTLFAQRWEVKSDKESVPEYVSSKKTWLPQQTVDMSAVFTDEGMRLHVDHHVNSHLMPITPARTITAAVGNIVRKISGDDASGVAMPASEELERAISTAIQQGQIPAQQANVWALIRPQKYALLDRTSKPQGTTRDTIGYAVLSGARLHKVLSGGGGWGEKHGLLALDPDSDYCHHDRAFEPSLGDDQDVEAEKREFIGEVAKPGDVIAFYVYKSPSDGNPADLLTPWVWSPSQAATATLIFGSLPSTMDTMQEVDITDAGANAQTELKVEENHFGMLSEQGMSLESSFLNTNITANRMQYLKAELHRQSYIVRRKKTVITKLDAPYTLFSIRGQASKISVSREVKGEVFQAHDVHLSTLMPTEPSTATAISRSVPALKQKLPNSNEQNEGAQQQTKRGSSQDDRGLAKLQEKTKEKTVHVTRKERRAQKLAASKIQSEADIRREGRVVAETESILRQHSKMTKVAKSRTLQNIYTQRESSILLPKEPHRLPVLIRRHPSNGLREADDSKYEDENKSRIALDDLEYGKESRSPPDDLKYQYESISTSTGIESEDEPDSVLVIREESEGKDPGSVHVGEQGNTFTIRKHSAFNPLERLQAIEKLGEIKCKEQAMRGLHGQYHLVLEDESGEVRKS